MKIPLAVALLLSLAVNGVLLLRRPSPPAGRPPPASVPAVPVIVSFAENPAGAIAAAWKLSADAGPRSFAARLRAAGVPERLVRALVTAAIDAEFRARETALRPPPKKLKFWQADDTPLPFQSRLALLDLQREKAKLRVAILGPDPAAEADSTYAQLPPEKREPAKTIVDDYDAMLASLRDQSSGLPLPSEREQIAFLEAQRHRDLAEALGSDEVADLERRTSPVAGRVRGRLRYFDASPGEFRAVFAAESAIIAMPTTDAGNEADVVLSPEAAREQAAEKARLLSELKSSLGEARYAEYLRVKQYDYPRIADLSLRAGLPPDTAGRVFDLRDRIAAESQRIAHDDTIDADQQRAALKTLAATSRAQLAALLGPEVSAAFSSRSESLLRELENGQYVVFGENSTSFQTIQPLPAQK